MLENRDVIFALLAFFEGFTEDTRNRIELRLKVMLWYTLKPMPSITLYFNGGKSL